MTEQTEMWVAADADGTRFLYDAEPILRSTGFIEQAGTNCMEFPECVVAPFLRPFHKVRVRLQTYGATVDCTPQPPPPIDCCPTCGKPKS